MTDSARADIFAKIQRASHGASANTIWREQKALGVAPRAALPSPDLATSFLANVLKNHGTVDCASDRSEAMKAVGKYLYRHFRSHRLVAGNDPHLAAMPWRDGGVLPRFGSVEPGEPAALSYALLGVAETGAIVTFTGKFNPAANNLLSEHHIVLLDYENLVTDQEQAWELIKQEMEKNGRPRGINFIAGPSSTADIEGKMIYGAHGPRSWHIVLIGNFAAAAALADAHDIAGVDYSKQ